MKYKCSQVVEWLIGIGTSTPGPLEVNNVNQSGLTALDLLLIFPSEAGDREIYVTLRGAGALRAQDIMPSFDSNNQTLSSFPVASETHQLQQPNDFIDYFKFKKGRDSPSDARTALLVVAVLVTTATFQVGLSPPNGVWQDTELNKNGSSTSSSSVPTHYAGRSIMGSYSAVAFVFFVAFNSIGFSVSLYMINILTSNFPLQLELQICILAMYCTYNTAVINIAPDNTKVFIIVFTSVLPSTVPLAAKWVRKLVRRLRQPLVNSVGRFISPNGLGNC